MIITRAPFRISFLGGGTDYPVWYEGHGGAVLGTTIDKYCYITCRYLPPFFDHAYRIAYSRIEMVQHLNEIQHPSVRECLRFVGIDRGMEIHHDGDLPARTGVGSSSSFTVALLHALYSLKHLQPTKKQLALDAIHVEQDLLRETVGCQDQTFAAFGGFNCITFGGPEKVQVQPVHISASKRQALQEHLLLVFTGLSRNASEVAEEQVRLSPQKTQELTAMRALVHEGVKVLTGNRDLTEFGELLHESWEIKRTLSPRITTPEIDGIYEAARQAGAVGGKLLGAGGGGFVVLFARPETHPRIKERLKGLLFVPFRFEEHGCQVIFQNEA